MFSLTKKKIIDVQTTSFTEILLIILFILIVFNFQSIETIDLKEKRISELLLENQKLKETISKQDKEIRELKKRIKDLEEDLLYYRKLASTKLGELVGKNLELRNTLRKYEQKYGKDGLIKTDKAVNFCRINGKDIFALDILATADYYQIMPLWSKSDEQFISEIPGLKSIYQTIRISRENFRKLFGATYRWGDRQETKCRFKVKLSFDKTNMSINLFDQLVTEVDRHFWKSRVR